VIGRGAQVRRGAAFRFPLLKIGAARLALFVQTACQLRLPRAFGSSPIREHPIDVARFRGVADVAYQKRCAHFWSRTRSTRYAEGNAPPAGLRDNMQVGLHLVHCSASQ
jgi:hypothetical protein